MRGSRKSKIKIDSEVIEVEHIEVNDNLHTFIKYCYYY